MRILYDCSHTSHCAANAGVQRVVRRAYHALQQHTTLEPTCFDPYGHRWRLLDPREQQLLNTPTPTRAKHLGLHWTAQQKISGIAARLFSPNYRALPRHSFDAFLLPEPFRKRVARPLAKLAPYFQGPKIAVFHDLIPLASQYTPSKKIQHFHYYLEQLLQFDGIAAVSQDSTDALREYWRQYHPTRPHPRVETIALGTDLAATPQNLTIPAIPPQPRLLFVSSLAHRKNHLALLDAAELLWQQGMAFDLDCIGPIVDKSISRKIIARINGLSTTHHRPVRWLGPVSDEQLKQAYQDCTFTVYPSRYEGFGLPLIESLSQGKPCVCTPGGALQEVAAAGGCHLVDDFTPTAIAAGIKKLLTDPAYYHQLQQEASHMTFRTWDDYTSDLLAFIEKLRPTVTTPKIQS